LESHQILPQKFVARGLRALLITAGREFHPAPKIDLLNFYYKNDYSLKKSRCEDIYS
jgi:hypothetical protein